MIRVVNKLREMLKKINLDCPPIFDEPLASHTSFRIGGPAEVFVAPRTLQEVTEVLSVALKEDIPYFVLGEGANILVSDRGIRGFVIDMSHFDEIAFNGTLVTAMAGAPMTRVVEKAVESGLAGIEAFAHMPGSIGGSVWMNARCYGVSVSDVLEFVELVDRDSRAKRLPVEKEQFDYKKSPFQPMQAIIIGGGFRLHSGDPKRLTAEMEHYRQDRERKGHFLYPCAGSVFKNNRAFGAPTGRLIDELGLKGYSVGGARISEKHANIIVNDDGATAADVRNLVEYVKQRVKAAYGFQLEEELLYVGEWEENDVRQP
jgi:UDP-N-acetylmuramate dehydrogenase